MANIVTVEFKVKAKIDRSSMWERSCRSW